MAKRRKIGMSNKERLYRSIGLMSAFLMLLSCLTLVVTLFMDITGLNTLEKDGPTTLHIYFWDGDRFLMGSDEYIRGEKIEKPGNPTHEPDEYFTYTFRGWDITGDNSPDIVPSRAYFDFDAVAVFQKKQIKPLPKSYSQKSSSSKDDSSAPNELDGSLIIEEVVVYGA